MTPSLFPTSMCPDSRAEACLTLTTKVTRGRVCLGQAHLGRRAAAAENNAALEKEARIIFSNNAKREKLLPAKTFEAGLLLVCYQ